MKDAFKVIEKDPTYIEGYYGWISKSNKIRGLPDPTYIDDFSGL